jgi:uncharacterized membrane protein YheB (UPF0754 family)
MTEQEIIKKFREKMNADKVLPGYELLHEVLHNALDQAQSGKGKERHACNEDFEDQQICEIDRRLKDSPVQGVLFQAVKKIYETPRLEIPAAIRELYGSVNYIGAAIINLERLQVENWREG